METLEFRAWLKKNHNQLRRYAPDEIAYLARLNGFDLKIVCSTVSDQVTHIKRLFDFWESPLNEQWLDLTAHETKGRFREDR